MSQPRELEPSESEVADAPLLDSAEPVAEQRSSPRRRLSRSLEVEMASLFWVSEGSLHFRDRRHTADHRLYSDSTAHNMQQGGTEPRECNGCFWAKISYRAHAFPLSVRQADFVVMGRGQLIL